MQKISSLFVFMLLSATTFSQTINTKKLDSLFDILDKNHLAMGSVAIAKDGKIVYQRQIGYAYIDGNKKIPANVDTKYRIGSITKMFTAVIIFQLIEEKKLSLDTKLAKFYPQIPNADKITIEMLLRHRSGLIDYINDSVDVKKAWITEPHSDNEILKKIINGKPHFSPDSTMSYCNSGYFLLAKIAEAIDKNKFENILRSRIFSRLALKNINSDSINSMDDNDAFPYSHPSDSWQSKQDFYFDDAKGCGNLLSTPTDLIKFIQALFDYKLVKKSSLDSMMRFPDSIKGFAAFFGTGIMRVPFYEKMGYGHNGGTYGQYSTLYDFTKDSLIIAQSFNDMEISLNDILVSELNICYDNPEDFSKYNTKDYPITSAELDKYIGTYTSKDLGKFVITKKDNQLYAQLGTRAAYPYKAIGKDKFELRFISAVLIFDLDKKELTLQQNGKTFLFTKDQ
ncbi:hypothetical protein A9P82_02775 [Arachidicoccus ginsenosidimutans]|uniref:serine hydrolase n=1 Tax=Arachidicoccus sp. BS20 TaxID=1850526 RepID=UPI0007F0EFA5|nr:serine hydrolase [Arachidicoccus sp. BS20]ANI88320.1 hypothetical protein A9P82_02775 [Arachidicoccus sp. BS20]